MLFLLGSLRDTPGNSHSALALAQTSKSAIHFPGRLRSTHDAGLELLDAPPSLLGEWEDQKITYSVYFN